ncbi:hypothetical protein KKH05_00955 [Patescibacteria group bacterium]|nr:hypothetical protein [Patescibacteria group bacterium]
MPIKRPIQVVLDLGDKVYVSPPIWHTNTLDIDPGDLTHFAPKGNGVYGYQGRGDTHPLTEAPPQEACGGVIYFGVDITREDFDALMRITEVQDAHVVKPRKNFGVFTAESDEPKVDGYVAQVRIVSDFGLRFLFGISEEDVRDNFPTQELSMPDVLWQFIEYERQRWGTTWMVDKGLGGMFGGDGNFAREELAFGFMVENDYHHVYRLWSRAWLVTK